MKNFSVFYHLLLSLVPSYLFDQLLSDQVGIWHSGDMFDFRIIRVALYQVSVLARQAIC